MTSPSAGKTAHGRFFGGGKARPKSPASEAFSVTAGDHPQRHLESIGPQTFNEVKFRECGHLEMNRRSTKWLVYLFISDSVDLWVVTRSVATLGLSFS